jgi:hypothetical protein
MRLKGTVVIVALLWSMIGLAGCRFGQVPPMPDIGKTQIAHGADVQVDEQTLRQILDTFHRADVALHKQDLDVLMTIYSRTYKYHGYDKDRLRLLWEDLFRLYERFSTTHVFSKIVVNAKADPSTAEITCSGSLWAISKLTGRRVNIDSWYADVHYLIWEDGAWRIRSHAWERPDPGRYVLSPHPFF